MPSSDYSDCADPEGRDYYAKRWAENADAELNRRAKMFGMPTGVYAKVITDYTCWLIYKYNAAEKHLYDRKRIGRYAYIDCKVEYNQHCSAPIVLSAPAGYQICRVIYSVASNRGDTRLFFNPADWLTPAFGRTGFRTYQMTFRADGSGAIFDQVGAHLKIEDVSLDVVSDRLTWQERRERGCDIPDREPPKPPVLVTNPTGKLAQNEITRIPGATSERFRVVMRNPGTATNRTYYEIFVFDPFWGKERLFQSDVVVLNPGDRWDYEFHKYGAQRWRFESRLIR